MYWQMDPLSPSVIGPMDRDDLWFFMPANVPADLKLTDSSAGALIRQATGIDMSFEILSSDQWFANRLIADRYNRDRVFIIGDACHLHPPAGGYGMNMGVADSVDLGWKLAAVLEGWAAPHLLDSYEIERRPLHRRVIDEAQSNASANAAVLQPGLEEDGAAGDELRARVGDLIRDVREKEFRSLGVVLGYTYAGSPFVAAEAGDEPPLVQADYRPSARPGSLAPHLWLDDGRSLYDLFGRGFTLLVLQAGYEEEARAAMRDADRLGIPMKGLFVTEARALELYKMPLVLVRPDQHVSWRGDAWPGDEALLRATGREAGAGARSDAGKLQSEGMRCAG
jgi:hypothetical protein